ncbi:MAG: chitobiase/beta-hexosaminidase C-terminal domain-containing protein [Candidatus Moranbacteria bacterium]|nr:chitobiase/beta-hexosaminidase C-terminal domain-containing protein [Candidatus Moranbacteria bacterium]
MLQYIQENKISSFGKMKTKRQLILLPVVCAMALFFFASARPASAATYYVSTTGDDGNPGTQAEPFATIQHGADTATAGDTVIVEDGTYADSSTQTDGDYAVYITTSGSSGSPITIQAENNLGAVIDDSGFSEFGIGFATGVHHIVIQGFEIKNYTYSGIKGDGYVSSGDEIHDITISRNQIDNIARDDLNPDTTSRTGITAPAHSYNFTIDSNTLNDIGRTDAAGSHIDHAIYLFGYGHTITNNVFYNDYSGWMVDISDDGDTSGSQNIQVSNNTFSGVACGDGESGQIIIENHSNDQVTNVIISNNISYGSIDSLVYWYSNSYTATSAYIRNNTSTESAIDINYPSGAITRSENQLDITDTLFVDSGNNDYHLADASPAISHSYAADAPDHDLDQVGRPQGSADDDGAYEYIPAESDAPTFTVNEGTDTGPTQTDTINVTVTDASSITASEYGYSSDSTCNGSDTYGNSFTSATDFAISGNHTEYLCVMATDEYSNTGYQLVGQLNTDNTAPTLSFTDNVAAGPVASDTVTGSWGDASTKLWDYDTDGTCSTSSGDYTKTDSDSMNQTDETNNGKYICLYGDDAAGNYDTLASANDINVDTGVESDAPTFTVNEGTDTGPTQTDTINVTVTDASSITASEYGYSSDSTCNGSDTYGNSFTSATDFAISGNHTEYLCVMATDEYSNTGYQLVGQLNTDNTAPTTTANPEGGTYDEAQTVTLTCNDSEADIYYTIDGSDPDTGSDVYADPIEISADTTLKFFAKDSLGNSESINTETYVIDPDAAEDISIPKPKIRLNGETIDMKPKKIYWSSSKTFVFRASTKGIEDGTVKIYGGRKLLKTAEVSSGGKWSQRVRVKKQKVYRLNFKYYDSAGEQVKSSGDFKIGVDKHRPEFTDLPQELTKRPGAKIWWEAKDNEGVDRYKIELDGKISKTTRKHFYLKSDIRLGYHTLRVKVYDKAGNAVSRKIRLRII